MPLSCLHGCSHGLEGFLRKSCATYSLIIVPDGIRHIGHHFLCSLKLKQNSDLHGPAAERSKVNVLAFFTMRILREHKWPLLALLSNRAFLVTGIIEAITQQPKKKKLNGTTFGTMITSKSITVKIPALP